MHLKIPREVLEEIFAHPAITEKDLFQLQLTCKYWSPVAQKHLYKELTLVLKKGLYRPPDGMETTIRLWVQRLLLLNVQIRKLVKRINVGSLFVHYDRKNEAQEKVIVNLATALHLCPNVTTLIGRNLPASLYEALSGLHASDNLQHLEHLSEPNIQSEKDWKALAPSYYKAIVGFKNTLKDITVFDAIGKKAAIDILIQPDYLQLFPCLEHLHLNELSRIHLFRLGRYISNCSARTRSISVEMGDATSVPLSPEYNEQSSITPQPQVKRLSMAICAKPLTANEMAYIMQMFPSLEHFSLATTMDVREGCIVPILHDTDVVFQFLNYLSRISQVGFGEIWFDASEGLALLPRLADLLNPHQVTIEYAEIDFLDIFSIKWDHETRSTRTDSNDNDANTTSKHSSLTIQIFSTDIQTKFYRALEVFKDRPVVINIGQYAPRSSFTDRQEITEESLDYIVNKSANILDTLVFNSVDFSLDAINRKTPRRKYLQRLQLRECTTSPDFFTQLSCRLEHVDCLQFNTLLENEDNNIRINMPFTTINTLELSFPVPEHRNRSPYTIKVWANLECVYLKATDKCMEKVENPFPPYHEENYTAIIQCSTLKEICLGSASFKLL